MTFREYMTRTERYERGLAISKRIYELQDGVSRRLDWLKLPRMNRFLSVFIKVVTPIIMKI